MEGVLWPFGPVMAAASWPLRIGPANGGGPGGRPGKVGDNQLAGYYRYCRRRADAASARIVWRPWDFRRPGPRASPVHVETSGSSGMTTTGLDRRALEARP